MVASVTWLGHATVLVELAGTRILTDPVLRPRVGPLVRQGPVPPLPDEVDVVLLSHLHRDHADLPTLRRLAADVPIVGPRGTAAVFARRHAGRVREVAVGDRVAVSADVTVTATPARHDGRRTPLPGAADDALGFVVAGPRRVYFAGDTDLFAGMERIGAGGLGAALLPVAGWGTSLGPGHLDPERAARAAALLAPRVAVPIHWGTYRRVGMGHPDRAARDRPVREFAAHLARLAPGVEARVLRPGEALEL